MATGFDGGTDADHCPGQVTQAECQIRGSGHGQNRKYRCAIGSSESGSQRSSTPSAVTV